MSKVMSLEELEAFTREHERWPTTEEYYKAPITWIPTYPRNPSKLEAHEFINGKWIPLGMVKFVPWPEAFPLEGEKDEKETTQR